MPVCLIENADGIFEPPKALVFGQFRLFKSRMDHEITDLQDGGRFGRLKQLPQGEAVRALIRRRDVDVFGEWCVKRIGFEANFFQKPGRAPNFLALVVIEVREPGADLDSADSGIANVFEKIGIEDIQVMVTHGLFTGDEWKACGKLGVMRIFCNDTRSPSPEPSASRIVTLSVAPLRGISCPGRISRLIPRAQFGSSACLWLSVGKSSGTPAL